MAEKDPSVLFVCLGNICRSPLAEGAFRAEAARLGLKAEVDSAGIGAWHIGKAPDHRAQQVAQRHGVDIAGLRARQVRRDDFYLFTHIVAMDHDNLAALRMMQPEDAMADMRLLLDYTEERKGEAVADPYFGSEAGFLATWEDVTAGVKGLVVALSGARDEPC